MAAANSVYCIDVFGVKNIGVEDWMESHYVPVSGREYTLIYKAVLRSYKKIFCNFSLGEEFYWLGASNFKIVNVVTDVIFNELRFSRLKMQGIKYIASDKIKNVDDYCDWPINNIKTKFQIPNPSLVLSLKNKVRRTKSFGVDILDYRQAIGKRKVCRIGALSNEVKSYCSIMNLHPINFDRFAFIKKTCLNHSESQNLAQQTHEFISKISAKYSYLSDERVSALSVEIINILDKSLNFIRNNVDALAKKKVREFLSIANGSPVNRALIAACRLAGREVIGFIHGNCFAMMRPNIDRIYHDSLSIASITFASSKGEADLAFKAASECKNDLKISEISCPEISMYRPTFDRLQKLSSGKTIKTIMVVGFPMGTYYYASSSHAYGLAMLRLELSLIKILKKAGYKILYKAHPDRLKEISNIFERYVDAVIVEPFESSYFVADCLLFPHFGTTTFGFSLMTKKPIVLIDHVENNDVFDDPMELIRKRCSVVNALTNDNDETVFDESELLLAIQNSVTNMDNGVVEKYAL